MDELRNLLDNLYEREDDFLNHCKNDFSYFNIPDDKLSELFFEYEERFHYPILQNNIGYMYNCGIGVEQNYELAMEWYLKAAAQNYSTAQINIGNMYYNGDGVEQNYELAMEWYLKAAAQNNSIAQTNIGDIYYNGDGVEQNYELAMEWYLKAATQNYSRAKRELELLFSRDHKLSITLLYQFICLQQELEEVRREKEELQEIVDKYEYAPPCNECHRGGGVKYQEALDNFTNRLGRY